MNRNRKAGWLGIAAGLALPLRVRFVQVYRLAKEDSLMKISNLALWLGLALGLGLTVGTLQAQPSESAPSIVYSTYLGGSNFDEGVDVAVDAEGNAYLTGVTGSADFPGVHPDAPPFPPFSPYPDPFRYGDIYVVKLGPEGTYESFVFVGFPYNDRGMGIAVNDTEVAVTGWISDELEAYPLVARMGKSLDRLWFDRIATFGSTHGFDVALDGAGNAYVAGHNPGGFVAKISTAGEVLFARELWGQYCRAVAVGSSGEIYLAGAAYTADLPALLPGQALAGAADVYVAKLDSSGSPVWTILLGGAGTDWAEVIALGPEGQVYVAGVTYSLDFPVTPGAPTVPGGSVFLAELSPEGERITIATFGGERFDELGGLALDPLGGLYLATATTAEGPDGVLRPLTQVLRLHPEDFRTVTSARLPGASGRRLAVDAAGNVVLTGDAGRSGFPVVHAFQPQAGGGGDAFVTKIALNRPPDCAAAAAAPATLWPPNGRLIPIHLQGIADPDGDPVTATFTAVHQDEPLTRAGSPDATGIGTGALLLRADRAGKGDGRVYRVAFEARDALGAACTGEVTVCVPHDSRKGAGCGDGGPLFESSR